MHHTGRYSKYIRPISIVLDVMVITLLSLYFFKDLKLNMYVYITYQTFAWLLIAFLVKFYEVFRFTTPVEIISKLFKQFSIFLLAIIAFSISENKYFQRKSNSYFHDNKFCYNSSF